MSKEIKCKVELNRFIFPRNKASFIVGEWGMIACDVIETLEGEPKFSRYGNITVKGLLPDLDYGVEYTLIGTLEENKNYGPQYTIKFFGTEFNLENREDQFKFLKMVLSESQVNLLFDMFDNPCDLLKNKDTESLTQVKGIGPKIAGRLIQKYEDHILYAKAYIELSQYGLSQLMIQKLINKYKSPEVVADKIRSNPYILMYEVDGIGWNKADAIALNAGFAPNSVERVEAFVQYYLDSIANQGHSYCDPWEIYGASEEHLGPVPQNIIASAFQRLIADGKLWHNEDKTKVALKSVYGLEKAIAKELRRSANADSPVTCDLKLLNEILKQKEESQGWEFTQEQKDGIIGCIENNVAIITGGAGVGKSSTVAGILAVLRDYSFAQTALAGRAADRLREVTGKNGFTIHRLLGFNPDGGFTYDRNDKLPYDIIILDEVSMVGGSLFYSLVQAIKDGAKLIMLGDENQLPAIGMLNLFTDMMNSNIVPTFKLTKIHRQAQKSAIITESLKIAKGKQITERNQLGMSTLGELKDLHLDIYDDKMYTQNRVFNHYVAEYERLGDVSKIQVIAPMKNRGDSSVLALNKRIQQWYNPPRYTRKDVLIKQKDITYDLREGDKFILRKNFYKEAYYAEDEALCEPKIPVFNGNLGTIIRIFDDEMAVDVVGYGLMIFPKKMWNHIELGYAITCHSFQGSSAPSVIIGLDYSAYTMLCREWLYTAITRAEQNCILCAENSALRYAISTSKVPEKRTFLKDILRELSSIEELENIEQEPMEE